MTISSFEALDVRFELSLEEETAKVSAPTLQIKTTKDTLLSPVYIAGLGPDKAYLCHY